MRDPHRMMSAIREGSLHQGPEQGRCQWLEVFLCLKGCTSLIRKGVPSLWNKKFQKMEIARNLDLLPGTACGMDMVRDELDRWV